MESTRSTDGLIPQTPSQEDTSLQMSSPPGIQESHPLRQDERGQVDVTSSSPHHAGIDNDQSDDQDLYIEHNMSNANAATLLDFPTMGQSDPIRDQTSSIIPHNSRLNIDVVSLTHEPARIGRRRRASSFDQALPIPRIALRPRFSTLEDSQGRQQPASTSRSQPMGASVSALPNPGFANRDSNRHDLLRPMRGNHFRHHTYGGSDSSSDIFSLAMELDATDAPFPSSEHNGTVPIIHNTFELSQLHQNLPPAVQTFVAPRDPTSSTRDISRSNRPRHSRKRPADTSFPRNPSNINQPSSIATASFGTPTGTCTLSTSSVSAFDHTSSPQWQDQSPGNTSTIFQGLQSPESQAREEFESSAISGEDEKSSSLPFDEVHLLKDPTEDQ
jgi:hypothetical protein